MNIIEKIDSMSTKKKIIIILIIILLTAILSVSVIIVFNSLNHGSSTSNIQTNDQQSNTSTIDNSYRVQANDYEKQADAAAANNNTDQAKSLYSQAQQSYSTANQDNNAADVEAKLYQLDHPQVAPQIEGPLRLSL